MFFNVCVPSPYRHSALEWSQILFQLRYVKPILNELRLWEGRNPSKAIADLGRSHVSNSVFGSWFADHKTPGLVVVHLLLLR